MEPIGIIHSCFKEKFGIPRQPGLVPAARAELELFKPYGRPAAVRGLEAFSHIWIIFRFHACEGHRWRDTVRPPRLGGNERIGVFASRSGFRPNNLGMSAVRLEGITLSPGPVRLQISGADILDRTPVLDIKPYVPYSDSLPDARGGFAAGPPPESMSVTFSDTAEAACLRFSEDIPQLRDLIVQMIRIDPRPAYYGTRPRKDLFGTRIYDLEVKWRCRGNEAVVTTVGVPE
jgi:tRNA-Thr(GGU) m(6)t(6)A37 methyltransferase TsaA